MQGVSQLGVNKNWTPVIVRIKICWIVMMVKPSKEVAGGREIVPTYRHKKIQRTPVKVVISNLLPLKLVIPTKLLFAGQLLFRINILKIGCIWDELSPQAPATLIAKICLLFMLNVINGNGEYTLTLKSLALLIWLLRLGAVSRSYQISGMLHSNVWKSRLYGPKFFPV